MPDATDANSPRDSTTQPAAWSMGTLVSLLLGLVSLGTAAWCLVVGEPDLERAFGLAKSAGVELFESDEWSSAVTALKDGIALVWMTGGLGVVVGILGWRKSRSKRALWPPAMGVLASSLALGAYAMAKGSGFRF